MVTKRKPAIVCVAGRKGGVGKSTTAICLANCLALAGKRVIFSDVDPQASASAWLGSSGVDVSSLALLRGQPVSPVVLSDNLSFIPGGTATDIRSGSAWVGIKFGDMRPFLLSKDIDYHIIDCPTNRNDIDEHVIKAADIVLVCVKSCIPAVSACSRLYADIRSRLAPKARLAIVLTDSDQRRRSDRLAEKFLPSTWPDAAFFVIPCDTEMVSFLDDRKLPTRGNKGWEGIEKLSQWLMKG